MFSLEKWSGTKSRYTCPKCNYKNEFTRFVDEAGNCLAEDVGICNRESKCGYRYKPKEYFADNPEVGLKLGKKQKQRRVNYVSTDKNGSQATGKPQQTFDLIPVEHLKKTISNYEQNAFVKFLLNLFPNCVEEIQDILKMYLVGTYKDYQGSYTCFPSIDRQMRVCKAKLIRFNAETGKRLKGQFDTSSLPAKLKLKEDFHYKQLFFGEHLLKQYPDKPVAIVESEKSAIVASFYYPELVWLGSNSKQWLNAERLQRLGTNQIILYPDADGFQQWQRTATDARRLGLDVKVSSLIEAHATPEQKTDGYDLADYLIQHQKERNAYNKAIDEHNLQIYAPDEQDLLDSLLECEAVLEYETKEITQ
jgi:hypothetical protein